MTPIAMPALAPAESPLFEPAELEDEVEVAEAAEPTLDDKIPLGEAPVSETLKQETEVVKSLPETSVYDD